MSDFSVYKKTEIARIGSSGEITTPAQPISQSHQREWKHKLANLSAAAAEEPVFVVPYAAAFIAGNLTVHANAVANSTDYSLVTVSKRTGNGAAVTVATGNLSNVALTKFIPVALTPVANAANTQLAKGDVVTVTTANTGNGTANNAIALLDFVIEDVA